MLLPAREYARNRAAWLEARRGGLGASEVAGVLGVSPWTTPYKVWCDKVATTPPVELTTEPIVWGHRAEAMIARAVGVDYPDLGRVEPSPGLLAHEEHPIIRATLDRTLVPRRSPRGTDPHGLLELKNIGTSMYRHAWVDGVPPVYYLLQVLIQEAVSGLEVGYLGVLVGGQRLLEPYLVEYDHDAATALIAACEEWWERYVVARVPPPLTVADADVLTRMYPGDLDLEARAADPDTLAAFGAYVDARRRRDEAEDQMATHGFAVKNYLGDHTALTDPETGAVLATWRPDKRGRRSFLVKE